MEAEKRDPGNEIVIVLQQRVLIACQWLNLVIQKITWQTKHGKSNQQINEVIMLAIRFHNAFPR